MHRILLIVDDLYKHSTRELVSTISYEFFFHLVSDITSQGVKKYIQQTVRDIKSGKIKVSAVVGCNEVSSALAIMINQGIGTNNINLDQFLYFQNKYISRLKQRECIKENIPEFFLSKSERFPIFVKPVCSRLSIGASKVNNKIELDEWIATHKNVIKKSNQIFSEIIKLGKFKHQYVDTYNDFICESLLKGEQITVDGYVYNNEIVLFGITLSNLMPNKISFVRFDYPHSFGTKIDKIIFSVSKKIIKGFGLNNSMFNIEFMVDGDKVNLIEIHCRLSLQFVSLIENVTGYNIIKAACDIALNIDPKFTKQSTQFNIASSCILRKNNDCLVSKVPSLSKISKLSMKYNVSIRSLIDKGRKLSDYPQDSKTFRYAIINIPGVDYDDIQDKLQKITQELDYEFAL